MSDLLAAAAEALGTPESLVQRSAEARAEATGASVDDILAAWAGEGPAPEPAAAEEAEEPEADAPEAEEPEAEEPEADAPQAGEPEAPAPAPRPATAAPEAPPVLVGARDNPTAVLLGALALFGAMFLLGFVAPSLPVESPGARSSALPYSALAEEGRSLYSTMGCVACHTQMVRPVVADVGLGAVTLNDSNQVLGTRRFGPDLSDVGSRLTSGEIEAIVAGAGGHPGHTLSPGDLGALVAYLSESRTSGTTGGTS